MKLKLNLSNPYGDVYRKQISESDKDYLNSFGKRVKQLGFRVHLKQPSWLIYLYGTTDPKHSSKYFGRIEIRRNSKKLFEMSKGSEYFVAFLCGTVDAYGVSSIDFGSSTKNRKVTSANLKPVVEAMFKHYRENFKG